MHATNRIGHRVFHRIAPLAGVSWHCNGPVPVAATASMSHGWTYGDVLPGCASIDGIAPDAAPMAPRGDAARWLTCAQRRENRSFNSEAVESTASGLSEISAGAVSDAGFLEGTELNASICIAARVGCLSGFHAQAFCKSMEGCRIRCSSVDGLSVVTITLCARHKWCRMLSIEKPRFDTRPQEVAGRYASAHNASARSPWLIDVIYV